MSVSTMSLSAWHAIRAESLRKSIGSYAARKYAVKHGVLGLYRLACQLSAVEGV
jgi:hypothetical protein